MKHARNISLITLAVAAGWAWYLFTPDKAKIPFEEMTGTDPAAFELRPETIPSINFSEVVGWKDGEKPTPAKGLEVTEFARDLDHPRWVYQLPNGDVLVAESTQPARETQGLADKIARSLIMKANGSTVPANRITLLRDKDGDGVAEFRSVLLEGLNSPLGMALVRDKLYVANTDALLEFPYKTGDVKITAKGKKLMDLPAGIPNNHWTRNVIADKAGEYLYITIGSHGNIGEEGGDLQSYVDDEPKRALIRQYNIKTGEDVIFAYGLRNPTGLAINPDTDTLWATVNERDMLGSDGPPDYMSAIYLGSFHGWPFFFWGQETDDRVPQARMDLRQYAKRPDFALGPHVAALGIDFADGAKLGDAYTRGTFVALHGSWNRKPLSGYKVVWVPFAENGYPVKGAKPVDLLIGFLDKDEKARGRPAGLIVDQAGGLLVADDAGNRIWRVRKG